MSERTPQTEKLSSGATPEISLKDESSSTASAEKEVKKSRRADVNVKTILTLGFLAVALISISSIGYLSYNNAQSALQESAFNELEAVGVIKKNQLLNYLSTKVAVMEDIQRNLRFTEGVKSFANLLPKGIESAEYQAEYNKRIDGLKSFMEKFGFYDVFLIDPDGSVVFSVKRESDLGENLETGFLQKSGLAEAFRGGKAETKFTDFAFYETSSEQASFLATPLKDSKGQLIGVAAVQVALNDINAIMEERTGLGKSGETYLVGQ